MDLIQQLGSLSAHAYLVRGPREELTLRLIEVLEGQGVEARGNPDCMVRAYETLSIDDVRLEIAPFAHFKPIGDRKFFILSAESILAPAQNALLKIVEEGSGKSVFFFVLEQGVPLLPTLESRCVVIKEQGIGNGGQGTVGNEFLKMNYADRLALAEKFAKDHDREGARSLVRSLLTLVDEKKVSAQVLRDLLDAHQFLALSGSSPKAIIGHLALVL
jgi:hypothetical protein